MKYHAIGGIPATVETIPNPYAGLPWVAMVHRSDDTPAPRFKTFQGTTEKAAAAAAIGWLGGTLTPRVTCYCPEQIDLPEPNPIAPDEPRARFKVVGTVRHGGGGCVPA